MTNKKQLKRVTSKEIIAEIYEITPALAAQWLETSKGNRPINKERVVRYARAMKAGRWYVTDAGIGFDESGALINGHHRLLAIVEAGVTIRSLVVLGIEEAAKNHMDVGFSRTPGHILGMVYGVPNPNAVAAIGRVFAAVEDGAALQSSAETERWYGTWQRNPESFAFGTKIYTGMPAAYCGVLVYAYSIDPVSIEEFGERIKTKVGITANSAESSFMAALDRIGKNAGAAAQQRMIDLTCSAIYHKLKKSHVMILRASESALAWLREHRVSDR